MTRRRRWWHATWCVAVALSGCDISADAAPARAPVLRAAGPTARPVRGAVHVVRMLLDNEGFRFEPAYVTVAEGDGVEFRMISGVPHNVAFDEAFIPRGSRAQLVSNLAAIGARDLAAPVVTTIDSTYVVSTAGLPTGDYLFYCAPHRSLNMHGVITVR
ncbi:MAG: plastocyanin/azurin family copper-binding protein [Gemmatimonadota bacterium]